MDTMVYIALAVVALIGLAYWYYQNQYTTSCPLQGGTPVDGQPGYCQRVGTPSIGSGSAGQWVSGSGASKPSASACAAHCVETPGCNVFQWNTGNQACALATYPSGSAADTGILPEAGYISGSKVVSRAQPW